MNPLLVVIPIHIGDATLASVLLEWINTLNQKKPLDRSVLLAIDAAVPKETSDNIYMQAKNTFLFPKRMRIEVPGDRQGWPSGPNYMFEAVARQIELTRKLPWLWLEPDCVPYHRNWLEKIEAEYAASQFPFMGAKVSGKLSSERDVTHMSGIAVYPRNTFSLVGRTTELERAFDVELGPKIVPQMHATKLIQHHWGKPGAPLTFTAEGINDPDSNVKSASFLAQDGVLFHRCKDGSLIDVLMALRSMPPRQPAPAAATAAVLKDTPDLAAAAAAKMPPPPPPKPVNALPTAATRL